MSRRPIVLLALFILAFTVAVSAVGVWKYAYYAYNGLDLAIYTNVLYNLSFSPSLGEGELERVGRWYSSIQGHSYLGDHVEPILLLLVPLFRLWPDARLLIIVQALVLGLSAIPVYLLLRYAGIRRQLSIVALYLLNPLLWNAALFEFHAIAFIPLIVMSATVAFMRRRFGWFLLFAFLVCAVREDVALMVMIFGVLAFMIRKKELLPWYWVATPFILGLSWFVVATNIGAAANPGGGYAFRVYYEWLLGGTGGGAGMMVWNVFVHPIQVFRHVISLQFFDGLLGLLLSFAFLPLLRPRWLLLALPPFAAIALSISGLSAVVVTLHYGLLFLPALTIATVYAMQRSSFIIRLLPIPRQLGIAMVVFLALGASVALGPFRGIADIVAHGASPEYRARRVAYDDLLARVPRDAVICAHAHALTALAARTTACNLSYALPGMQQFGRGDYPLPANLAYILLDPAELREDAMVYPNIPGAAAHAADMEPRLRGAVAQYALRVVAERDGIVLLQAGGDGPPPSDNLLSLATSPRRGYRMPGALRDLRVVPIVP